MVFMDFQEDWMANVIGKVKESQVGASGRKFECAQCGLKLMSEAGIEEHLQRRSIEVRLPCLKCNIVHICYNPCQVLGVMRLCDTEVAWGVNVVEVRPHIAGLPVTLRSPPDTLAPSSGKFTAEELIRATRTCHECKVFCADDSLEAHMTFSTGLKLACQTCGQRMPTRCAQQAHWRLHAGNPPFVCPECGKMAPRDTPPEQFLQHVHGLCHHRERALVFQCPNCPAVHDRDRELAAHIADAHVQMLYKCSLCSLAFRDTSAFVSHSSKSHPYATATPVSVIKCPMCEACVFADTEMLIQHFLSIHTSSCAKFVFRCHVCRQLRTDQLAIHEHHKAEHAWQPLFADVMAAADERGRLDAALIGVKAKARTGDKGDKAGQQAAYAFAQGVLLRCVKCAFESTNRVQFLQHIRSHREGETPYQCPDCGLYLADETALSGHLPAAHEAVKPAVVTDHLRQVAELVALITKKEGTAAVGPVVTAAGAGAVQGAHGQSPAAPASQGRPGRGSTDKKPQRPKCPVCNLSCADAKALEFHMRTHGTAFLKSYNKQRKN
ncbi:zinc finger protein-like [Tropilaelaps mercedesae]|uniref:Zinc finger protein-like n=1 Tax=Tropilaelaps mercedesae TaxID=418985 RepID=A0A1V9XV26_9ACAR|nr:zinc finger protein-like [Tropilaelaps mercedesae]